jgi:hypothetical protein
LLDEQGRQVPGSLPAASTALAASSDEAVRQSALAMFQTLEQWVVDNGYLDIVALRNRFIVPWAIATTSITRCTRTSR